MTGPRRQGTAPILPPLRRDRPPLWATITSSVLVAVSGFMLAVLVVVG